MESIRKVNSATRTRMYKKNIFCSKTSLYYYFSNKALFSAAGYLKGSKHQRPYRSISVL